MSSKEAITRNTGFDPQSEPLPPIENIDPQPLPPNWEKQIQEKTDGQDPL